MGPLGASCFHTISNESRDLPKPQWDAERMGQLCAKPEVFADVKKTIAKLCQRARCTEEEVKQFTLAFDRGELFEYKLNVLTERAVLPSSESE